MNNEQLQVPAAEFTFLVRKPHTRIANLSEIGKHNTREEKALRLRPDFSIYKMESIRPGFMMKMCGFSLGLSLGRVVKE